MIEIPKEMEEYKKVLVAGAKKYGENSWLQGRNFNFESNCDSMFHHLAEHYSGKDKDEETGLDPLLHLACRALMAYTLKQRGKLE